MADTNYNPNARYDNGPNAAGSNGVSKQSVLTADATTGLQTDSTLSHANLRVGLNAAGVSKNNIGPNAAGQPRSVNST
jgi:hypothetical protein